MNEAEHELSAQQMLEAQQALDVAAFNGILSLAIILRKRNLLTDADYPRHPWTPPCKQCIWVFAAKEPDRFRSDADTEHLLGAPLGRR